MGPDEPKLLARFFLDDKKVPEYSGKTEGKKNYSIRIFIKNAPSDTHAVTYQLDPSYFDPVREIRSRPTFEEEITSYGDYDLQARIRRKKRADVLAVRLSEALREGHASAMTPEIEAAIRDIEGH